MNYEYGMEIPSDVTSYINTDKTDPELIKNATLDLSGLVEEGGLVPVGDYEIVLSANGKEYVIKVKVSDTKAPQFKDGVTDLETEIGVRPNYESYFNAEDLSEFTLTIDDSAVDYNTPGQYTVTVLVVDEHGNENTTTIDVTVLEEKEEPNQPVVPPVDNGNNGGSGEAEKPTKPDNGGSNGNESTDKPTQPEEKPQEEAPAPQPETPSEKPTEPSQPTEPEKPAEPNNCPYEMFVITTYQGHRGFFFPNSKRISVEHHNAVIELSPMGGTPVEIYVGEYDDLGPVLFEYIV